MPIRGDDSLKTQQPGHLIDSSRGCIPAKFDGCLFIIQFWVFQTNGSCDRVVGEYKYDLAHDAPRNHLHLHVRRAMQLSTEYPNRHSQVDYTSS